MDQMERLADVPETDLMEEDGTFRLFYAADGILDWDFSRAILRPDMNAQLSYFWEHRFDTDFL